MKFLYILEMMIQTIDGVMNEPIGVFTEEEEAEKWLKECKDSFSSRTTAFSVIPLGLDAKPPLLEMTKEITDKNTGHQLAELYKEGVFEQMVEPDGSFSYQIKDKYKSCMEKAMTRRFDKDK